MKEKKLGENVKEINGTLLKYWMKEGRKMGSKICCFLMTCRSVSRLNLPAIQKRLLCKSENSKNFYQNSRRHIPKAIYIYIVTAVRT